jgi:DNA-binding transcriptional LysR family regulator
MDTLNNMRIFVRVVEAGSFTRAAQHFDSTTAQISRAIADLEQHLHARLLHRTTRRISVTEAGQRYLQRCERILSFVDEAEAEAADANVRASGTLRIHGMTSFGQRYLVPSLARYRENHPEVMIELTLSQRTPDLIDEGYDVAVVIASSLPDSGMISQRVGSVFSVLCASPDYIARHGTPATPDELSAHACLQFQTSFFPMDVWVFEPPAVPERSLTPTDRGEAPPLRRHVVHLSESPLKVNVAEAMNAALREGMGIGLLPSYSAIESLQNGSLVRLFGEYQLPQFHAYALYPSRQYIDAKIRYGHWAATMVALTSVVKAVGPHPA